MAVDVDLAYEYESYNMFDEREEEYANRIKSSRNASKRRRSIANVKVVLAALLVLVLFSAITYEKSELSKLYSENSELETELAELNNDNISLESELAQKTGLTKVEEYAENELGLQKLDKSQIEYVEIEQSTTAQTVSEGDDNIFVRIKAWFDNALEYLGL
ncbi:MAG: cell division protein FtsL [Ruminococcus sp.]|nr:cell division protein FtsL [Ruminococcus sp.]